MMARAYNPAAWRFRPRPLASPLPGVSDVAWDRFVRRLDVQPQRAVSESGGLGSYDLRPRRLVELGLARNLVVVRSAGGRQVYDCEFLPPLTKGRLLADPLAQLAILRRSMMLYHAQLAAGEIATPSELLDLAGMLAILHRGGRGALAGWPQLFSETRALYEVARGAF